MTDDMSPDAANELRLLRAEIAAMRWLPVMRDSRLVLPENHYRLMKWLRTRIHRRSVTALHPVAVDRQRRSALWLLVTTAVRVAAWTILIACVAGGILGIPAFAWAKHLSASIPFVALISLYANWATDFGAGIAAYAALVAADVHSQLASASAALSADLADIDTDISRLAAMLPGTEAAALAASLSSRLAGKRPA